MNNHCSFWLDRLWGKDWSRCCKLHDRAYENGVNQELADLALEVCVSSATGWPAFAWLMGAGVSLFGWYWHRRANRKLNS